MDAEFYFVPLVWKDDEPHYPVPSRTKGKPVHCLSHEDHEKLLFAHLYSDTGVLHRPVFYGPLKLFPKIFIDPEEYLRAPFPKILLQSEESARASVSKKFPFHLFPDDHFIKNEKPTRRK
jgi:hypothetical protein